MLMGIFLLTAFSISVYSQSDQQREQVLRDMRERQKQNERFDRLRGSEFPEIDASFFKLSNEAEQFIAPSDEEKAKYKDFLRLSDTEIVKIFNPQCHQIGDVELGENCKFGIPGFGNYYSFRHRQHFFPALTDVQLYKNWFVLTGFLTQGIIVSLGEIDLEKISLQSDGVKFLTDFTPAENPQEADKQAANIENGIENGKYVHNRAAKVEENTAYAMRTIAYRSNIKTSSIDKREDTIVIFKVINQDEDGNVTIIWRKLLSKKAPKLKIKQ